MEELEVKYRNGNNFTVKPGAFFSALFGRKKSKYQYLGIMPDGCGYGIYLHDDTDGSYLNVEAAWFSERKIKLVG